MYFFIFLGDTDLELYCAMCGRSMASWHSPNIFSLVVVN